MVLEVSREITLANQAMDETEGPSARLGNRIDKRLLSAASVRWQAAQLVVNFIVDFNFGRCGLATAWHSVQQRTCAAASGVSFAIAVRCVSLGSNTSRQTGVRFKRFSNSMPAKSGPAKRSWDVASGRPGIRF